MIHFSDNKCCFLYMSNSSDTIPFLFSDDILLPAYVYYNDTVYTPDNIKTGTYSLWTASQDFCLCRRYNPELDTSVKSLNKYLPRTGQLLYLHIARRDREEEGSQGYIGLPTEIFGRLSASVNLIHNNDILAYILHHHLLLLLLLFSFSTTTILFTSFT